MEGVIHANDLISRDENLHKELGALIYRVLNNKLTNEEMNTIMKEGVEIAIMFSNDMLKNDLVGMNKKMMKQHIKYTADELLMLLGHPKLYNVDTLFHFTKKRNLSTEPNMFETPTINYRTPENSNINYDDMSF